MPVANGSEHAGPVYLIRVRFRVQNPILSGILFIDLGVFAWKWYIALSRIATTGSIPCQNRWLGSKFAPIVSPTASLRHKVSPGLYTTKPGCISKHILTPSSLHLALPNRDYFSFHCHWSISRKSGGQGQVTQFGFVAFGPSPGQPEKSITRVIPSISASCIVFLLVS